MSTTTVKYDRNNDPVEAVAIDGVSRRVTWAAREEHLHDYGNMAYGKQYVSETPFPTRTWRGNPKHDLTGKQCGQVNVVGWFDSKKKSGRNLNSNRTWSRWVGKCSCGYYSIFTGKALRKKRPHNPLCCNRCDRQRRRTQNAATKAAGGLKHATITTRTSTV